MFTGIHGSGTDGLAGIANRWTSTCVLCGPAAVIAWTRLCGADAQDDGGAASENVLFSDHCFSPFGSINVAMCSRAVEGLQETGWFTACSI
jgi:hypothetical protein